MLVENYESASVLCSVRRTYYTSANGRFRNMEAAIPEHNIIIDVERDARKVLNDSPCVS
jgi:hypothetical protein